MKVLLVGDADSNYLKSTIERTLLSFGDKASILSPRNNTFKDYYIEHGIKVYLQKKKLWKFGTILSGLMNINVLKNRFDLVCFHFITNISLCMIPVARLFSKRIIVSYWGSDILKKTKPNLLTRISLNYADCITMITEVMKEKFCSLYGHGYDSKIHILDFGSEGIEQLKKLNKNQMDIKKEYGIPEGKIVVSIGYNNRPEQQHVEVLKSIQKLSKDERDRIHLLLRLTYGLGDQKYIDEIKRNVEKTACSYTYFESYLSGEKTAEITELTDIFIHAQTSDARSATMCEHLYSGCVVINPTWIDYSDFSDKVFFLTFDGFEHLGTVISQNLENKENSRYIDKLTKNREAIANLCSWDKLIPEWRIIYVLEK